MIIIAYVFGILAGVSNSATNVMQRAANQAESPQLEFSFQLIKNLVRRPLWLAGIATMMASFVFQAIGLGFGTLAAIEPLLVLELPLTLVGARIFLGSVLGRREVIAIGVMTAGTIGLIGFLGPTGGHGGRIAWQIWLVAGIGTAIPVCVLYWLGRATTSPGRRAALLGTGAGISFGLAAAFIKGMTQQFSSGGVGGVLTSWQLYTAGAAGVLAFWMNQNAINAGRLAAAQPGVTLADPYVSIIWGAVVFHEAMRAGFWVVAAIISGVAMSVGAIILARSPGMSGSRAASETGELQPERATEAA
jgi:drug/metabolite transporter (DMT)-like permease